MLNKFLTLQESHPEKVSAREIHAAIYINLYGPLHCTSCLSSLRREPWAETDSLDCRMAGHDVLAITLRAIWYYLAQNPRVVKNLREEIATARREEGLSDDENSQLPYSKASSLPYL